MNHKSRIRLLIVIAALATFLSSCKNDIDLNDVDDTMSVNGAMVFPLVQSTVTLKDFIDKLNIENITTNSNNILTVSYKPNINNSFDFNITPVNVYTDLSLPTSSLPAGTITKDIFNNVFGTTHPIQVQIDLSKISSNVSQLDSIIINNASLNIALNTNISFATPNLRLTITSPNLNYPNGYFPKNMTVGSVCALPFSGKISTTNSVITLWMTLEAVSNVTIPASPTLSTHVAFDNIDFKYVYGKFDYTLPAQAGTVDLSFLNDAISNTSYLPFKDPTIKIMRTTNAGLPVQLNVNYIKSYNNASPSNARFAFNGSSSTQPFPVTPDQPGKSITDSLVFNKANGNIDNLFTLPGINTIDYSFGAQISTTSSAKQYIMKSNSFKVEPVVDIPFAFNPNVNIQFLDTMSLGSSFTDFTNKSNLDNVKLWLTVNNYTSSKMAIDVTLLDANQQFISTQNITVNATLQVDANGVATQTPTAQDQACSLAFTANDIKKAQYVKLGYTLAGKDATSSMTLKSTDFIKAKLSVYVKGNAKIN